MSLTGSNPRTLLDINGACANSQLDLTSAKIAAMVSTKVSYGFAVEAAGHCSLVVRYGSDMTWDSFNCATWNLDTTLFGFEQRERCKY